MFLRNVCDTSRPQFEMSFSIAQQIPDLRTMSSVFGIWPSAADALKIKRSLLRLGSANEL